MNIRPGSIFTVGNKLMGMCRDCEKIVRMDKPIFGSLHVCLSDEERNAKRMQQNRYPF